MTTAADTKALVERIRKLIPAKDDDCGAEQCSECIYPRLLHEAADMFEALSSSASSETPQQNQPTEERLVAIGLRAIRLVHAWLNWRRSDRRVTAKRAKLAEDAFFAGVAAADADPPKAACSMMASQQPEKNADDAPIDLTCDPREVWARGYNDAMTEVYGSTAPCESEPATVKCLDCGAPVNVGQSCPNCGLGEA